MENTVSIKQPAGSEPLPGQIDFSESEPPSFNETPLFSWLKENWMMKLGVLFILSGVSELLYYLYYKEILNHVGISVIGIVIGIMVMVFGSIRISEYKNQGAIFTFLGLAIIMMTSYFMQSKHIITDTEILVVVMFLVLTIGSYIAVRNDKQSLALSSIILALVNPAIFGWGTNWTWVSLYSYLLLVTLGCVWVIYLKRWNTLSLASMIAISIYSLTGIMDGFTRNNIVEDNAVLSFAFLFFALFLIENILYISRNTKENYDDGNLGILCAIFNGIMITTVIVSIYSPNKTYIYSLVALVSIIFLIASFFIYSYTKNLKAMYVYDIISFYLLMYIMLTEFGNSFNGVSVILTLFILSGSFILYYPNKEISYLKHGIGLYILPLLIVFAPLYKISGHPIGYHNNYYDYFPVIIFIASSYFTILYSRIKENYFPPIAMFMSIVAFIISLVLMDSVVRTIVPHDLATTITSIVFSIIGVVLYIFGSNHNMPYLSGIGKILVAGSTIYILISGRVFNILFSNEISIIIGVIILGIALMSTAFFIRNKN